jgi:SAM-dependent methyltransferase
MSKYPKKELPSQMDVKHLELIRANVTNFLSRIAEICNANPGKILDIGPQNYKGITPFLKEGIVVETLDIDPKSNCTYIGDICHKNNCLPDNYFDYVICTEVLEHTLQPFAAVTEIWRILKSGGVFFLSVPFNFRIHGPSPDCWRFTEDGLRALLADFTDHEINVLETPERPLMPIHYTVIARKHIRKSLICSESVKI